MPAVITAQHRDAIYQFFQNNYPSVTKDQIDRILNSFEVLVILAEDHDPKTLETKNAKVKVLSSMKEVPPIIAHYLRSEYCILSQSDFIAPDFLLDIQLNSTQGLEDRVPYSFDYVIGEDPVTTISMLVDTGSKITYLVVTKDEFERIPGPSVPYKIKGQDTMLKYVRVHIYINTEDVGEIKTVYCGGSFEKYLAGQWDHKDPNAFPKCQGILGMDILKSCNLTVCKGRATIHFI
jgi:hypothetical protein